MGYNLPGWQAQSSMSDHPSTPNGTSDKTLFTTSVEIRHFASDWTHCDQLSNFLARSASLDRPDPFFFANLLSTILNEVFESIFHHHAEEGEICLSLRHNDAATTLDASIPVNPAALEFYARVSRDLAENHPDDLFRNHLLGPPVDDHAIGFFELAAIYQARIQIQPVSDGKVIHLIIQVHIDDAPQAAAA